jgi:predicted  nucleic acid-binding Zn-ribbon protein
MRNEYEMTSVIKRQEKEIATLHEKCVKLKRQIELGLSDRETHAAMQSDLERTAERCKTMDDDLRNVQGLVCNIASKIQDAKSPADSGYTQDELLESAMDYVKTLIHYLDDAIGDSPAECLSYTDI